MSLETAKRVRQVLARHGVDIGKVRAQFARDVVVLNGELLALPEAADLTVATLNTIDQELRLIKGVRRVRWNVSNWTRESGDWEST